MGREGVSKLLGVLRPVNHYGYIKARGEKERHLKKRGGKKREGTVASYTVSVTVALKKQQQQQQQQNCWWERRND